MAAETLDQYNARLQQLAKHFNFHEKYREVKSQSIQRCAMSKVRDKGLSEPTITLRRLLIFGCTLEATLQRSKIIENCSSSVPTPVHALTKTFPPDGQGTPHKYNRPVMGSQQRYRRHIESSTGVVRLWWTATRRSANVQILGQDLLQVSETK